MNGIVLNGYTLDRLEVKINVYMGVFGKNVRRKRRTRVRL